MLFDYLKNKALDDKTKNKLIYEQIDTQALYSLSLKKKLGQEVKSMDYINVLSQKTPITFDSLYHQVLKKIEEYKHYENKTPYLLVLNNIESIIDIIALIVTGHSPILLNGNSFIQKEFNDLDDVLKQGKFFIDNKIICNYQVIPFDTEKIMETLNKCQSCMVINNPGNGRIGIFSSGSLGLPKVVYVKEEDIINNVFKSKFNNRYRKIYNTAPLSSISGLFTNIFLPLINDNTEVKLTDNFNFKEAIQCTDVYLPRNYQELLGKEKIEQNVKIEKIFIFGDISNKGLIKTIRSKIKLPENTFVHVFGCTECGGLVSEFEEKDFDELKVYAFNVENDSIIYSYNNVIFYEIAYGRKRRLYNDEREKYTTYKPLKSIPCGLLSENNIRINQKTIGEGIVNDFYTGDIFVTIDDKLYVLGRKANLEKNHFIANFDAEISSIIGNRTCSTFTNETNKLCLAIKYPLDYNERSTGNDYTTQFRRLIKISQSIDKIVRRQYPFIDEIIYLTGDKFQQSGGLKKTVRSSLENFINDGRTINHNLENYDEVLKNHIDNTCQEKLGFIPNYELSKEKNIIMSRKNLQDYDLFQLLNDLSIVLITKDKDNYYIYYDDAYFFDKNKGRKYSDEELLIIEDYAENDLLCEKLAANNKQYIKRIKDNFDENLKHFDNFIVYYKEYTYYDGSVLLIPYYFYSYENNYLDVYEIANNSVNNYINTYFKNLHFTESNMRVALPAVEGPIGMSTKPIFIDKNGNIEVDTTDNEFQKFLQIIGTMYERYKDVYILGGKNEFKY